MAQSRPPKSPSKAPSKPPPNAESDRPSGKSPVRRQTMEVQLAWLEADAGEAPPASASKRKPPRLPGAAKTLPPMPHIPSTASMPAVAAPPPRRHTMEVDMSWLELVDDKAKAESAETKDASAASKKKKKKKHKPIPREE